MIRVENDTRAGEDRNSVSDVFRWGLSRNIRRTGIAVDARAGEIGGLGRIVPVRLERGQCPFGDVQTPLERSAEIAQILQGLARSAAHVVCLSGRFERSLIYRAYRWKRVCDRSAASYPYDYAIWWRRTRNAEMSRWRGRSLLMQSYFAVFVEIAK